MQKSVKVGFIIGLVVIVTLGVVLCLCSDNGLKYYEIVSSRENATFLDFKVDNGDVHAVYVVDNEDSSSLFYKRSFLGGNLWSFPIKIAEGSYNMVNSTLDIKNNFVHVLWWDYSVNDVNYKRSSNNGLSWDDNVVLFQISSFDPNPLFTVSNNAIHVLDHSYIPNYYISVDNGITWNTNNLPGLFVYDAYAFSQEENLYYIGRSGGNLNFISSNDEGDSWNNHSIISSVSWLEDFSLLYLDSDNLYIAFASDEGISFSKSDDNGLTWSNKTFLSSFNDGFNIFDKNAIKPSIAASGNNINIVWHDWIDDSDVYIKSSFNGGESWTENKIIFETNFYEYNPELVFDNNILHLVWQINNTLPNQNYTNAFYYSRSSNNGLSWGNDIIILKIELFLFKVLIIVLFGFLIFKKWEDYFKKLWIKLFPKLKKLGLFIFNKSKLIFKKLLDNEMLMKIIILSILFVVSFFIGNLCYNLFIYIQDFLGIVETIKLLNCYMNQRENYLDCFSEVVGREVTEEDMRDYETNFITLMSCNSTNDCILAACNPDEYYRIGINYKYQSLWENIIGEISISNDSYCDISRMRCDEYCTMEERISIHAAGELS